MIRPIGSDRQWTFEQSPEVIWARLRNVEDYRGWWPWLRRFDPGDGLVAGTAWCCEVSPPLPYVVRFTVSFDRVEVAHRAETTLAGDVEGTATLTLVGLPHGGTAARLVSHLAPASPLLRAVGALARPVVVRGHDWVLDDGRRRFVDRAMG